MSANGTNPTEDKTSLLSPADRQQLLEDLREEAQQMARRDTRVSPIRLMSMDDIYRFATTAAASSMLPASYKDGGRVKLEDVVLAVQMGSELGLPPMQSILNIAVINGRPSVWGDAMPGLCRASGRVAYIKEWSTGDGDTLTWHCEAKRKDDPNPIVQKFSVEDAKVAKLWNKRGYNGKDTPWVTNPGRMLQMRARGFALRDAFPDVLRGLISSEEAMDIPADSFSGITISPEPADVIQPSPHNPTVPSNGEHAFRTQGLPPKIKPTVVDHDPDTGEIVPPISDEEWISTTLPLLRSTKGPAFLGLLEDCCKRCPSLSAWMAINGCDAVVSKLNADPKRVRQESKQKMRTMLVEAEKRLLAELIPMDPPMENPDMAPPTDVPDIEAEIPY